MCEVLNVDPFVFMSISRLKINSICLSSSMAMRCEVLNVDPWYMPTFVFMSRLKTQCL